MTDTYPCGADLGRDAFPFTCCGDIGHDGSCDEVTAATLAAAPATEDGAR